MLLDLQPTVSRDDIPSLAQFAVGNDKHLPMEGGGWADVPRHTIEFVTRFKLVGPRRLQDEVFFILQQMFRIGQVGKDDAVSRWWV